MAVFEVLKMECGSWKSLSPSPFGRRELLHRLIDEVEVIWIGDREKHLNARWLREYDGIFWKSIKNIKDLAAYSINKSGETVRVWRDIKSDLEHYHQWDNCPIEAVYPPSIIAGQPSFPALPIVRQLSID